MHLNAESMRLERLSVPELQAECASLSDRERPADSAWHARAIQSFAIAQNFRPTLQLCHWTPLGCVA